RHSPQDGEQPGPEDHRESFNRCFGQFFAQCRVVEQALEPFDHDCTTCRPASFSSLRTSSTRPGACASVRVSWSRPTCSPPSFSTVALATSTPLIPPTER